MTAAATAEEATMAAVAGAAGTGAATRGVVATASAGLASAATAEDTTAAVMGVGRAVAVGRKSGLAEISLGVNIAS